MDVQYSARPLLKFNQQTTPRTILAMIRMNETPVKHAKNGHCANVL